MNGPDNYGRPPRDDKEPGLDAIAAFYALVFIIFCIVALGDLIF